MIRRRKSLSIKRRVTGMCIELPCQIVCNVSYDHCPLWNCQPVRRTTVVELFESNCFALYDLHCVICIVSSASHCLHRSWANTLELDRKRFILTVLYRLYVLAHSLLYLVSFWFWWFLVRCKFLIYIFLSSMGFHYSTACLQSYIVVF